MHSDKSIRDLYDEILNFESNDIYNSLIKKWVIENNYYGYLTSLKKFIRKENTKISIGDSWELYALSRVLDILTLNIVPNSKLDSSFDDLIFSFSDYVKFNRQIGLDVDIPSNFNSFNCEIVKAVEGKTNFSITDCLFPAVKLGNLMIKRAGVIVTLNPAEYNLEIVNDSKIYWAYCRKNRDCEDLSHGWGSNSQWRTSLRLDIDTEDSYIYNLEGKFDLNKINSKKIEVFGGGIVDYDEVLELLKYRHFVTLSNVDNDVFPYYFKYEERKNHF